MISVLTHKKSEMLDSMARSYLIKTHFTTSNRRFRRTGISMKMLVIQLKSAGVLCDPMMSLNLKSKFNRTVIRSVILYVVECCPTKKRHVQQLSIAEMRILRWICGHTRGEARCNIA
jgi:hypothetical protein